MVVMAYWSGCAFLSADWSTVAAELFSDCVLSLESPVPRYAKAPIANITTTKIVAMVLGFMKIYLHIILAVT